VPKITIVTKINLFIIISSFFALSSWANNSLTFDDGAKQVKIKSKIIDIKRKSQTIYFIDNVSVESGDSSLIADRMKVIYEEDSSNSDSNIKRIDAFDNVKIFANDFVATAKKGHYDPRQDVFILQEEVVVNNGMSIASGEHFLYDLKNEKGIFIGQKNKTNIASDKLQKDGRVQVIINQDLESINNEERKD